MNTTATPDLMDTGPLLSTREVGERLGVSRVTAWRLVRNGELRAYRVGGQIRVASTALENYLRAEPAPLEED